MISRSEAFFVQFNTTVAIFLAVLLTAVALGLLIAVFRKGRMIRVISGTLTERIASATQGYTELHGKAIRLKGPEIQSPGGKPCVWWTALGGVRSGEPDESFRYEGIGVDQLLSNANGQRRRSDELFGISDGTGLCIIDPDEAIVEHSSSAVKLSLNGYRIREKYILEGDDLYVIGQFRTLNHEGIAQDRSKEVATRIRFWKQEHMPELIAEFDRNGDGKLCAEEWQAVRNKAIDEIEREYRQRALDTTPHLIHAPDDGHHPFIIAAAREADYLQMLSQRQWLHASVAFTLLATAAGMLRLKGIL